MTAYIANKDGSVPSLADLPTRWDREQDPFRRSVLLYAYLYASEKYPSAWDGCRALVATLRSRGEPLPPELHEWAVAVAAGVHDRPVRRGNPGQAERDERITHIYAYLAGKGLTPNKIEDVLKTAVEVDEGRPLDQSVIDKIVRRLKLRKRFGNYSPE